MNIISIRKRIADIDIVGDVIIYVRAKVLSHVLSYDSYDTTSAFYFSTW